MPLFIYENLVEDNVKTIKKYTHKKIMAVLKNNAYGMSLSKMVELLKMVDIDYFVLEKYQEYLKYQEVLKKEQVLILESPTSLSLNLENEKITYSVNSLIDAINLSKTNKKIKVHLRIDSGMNRIGIRSIAEMQKVIKVLKANKNIYIEGLYTHFATDAFESKYYEKQLKLFKKYEKLYNFSIIHANATKSLNKELIGNYVRVGMALYGYHQPLLPLKKTLSLTVKPCSIFKVDTRSRIGYSDEYVNGKQIIGLIPLGYNDIDLTDINYFYYQHQKYQVFSKNCMNHTHFLANDKINYLSWLSILPTNGIISISDEYNINWYHILTSLKNMPKNYLRRSNYDLPKIFKYHGSKSFRTKFRTGSN